MTILLTIISTYLSLGIIFTAAIAYREVSGGVTELDTIPNIIFSIIKIIVLWLPLVIVKYIWD